MGGPRLRSAREIYPLGWTDAILFALVCAPIGSRQHCFDRDDCAPHFRCGRDTTLTFSGAIADRFGHYALCCDTAIKSPGLLNSGELWLGPRISFDGLTIFDTVKIGAAATGGFSFTTNSIGRERQAELAWDGSARVLFYLEPELSFSLVDNREWEFVYALHHRSGANGLLGNIREGYNANIAGVRCNF